MFESRILLCLLTLGLSSGVSAFATSALSIRMQAPDVSHSREMTSASRRPSLMRRGFVGASFGAAILAGVGESAQAAEVKAGPKLPQEQWDQLVQEGKLSKLAYQVLHDQATERPFTSALLKEKRNGIFTCAACGTELFASNTKFDSGTGWPSFYDKLPGVEMEEGNLMDMVINMRNEVHCTKCGGHLGHVFNDGIIWQVPTGKRYCINGVSLGFKEA